MQPWAALAHVHCPNMELTMKQWEITGVNVCVDVCVCMCVCVFVWKSLPFDLVPSLQERRQWSQASELGNVSDLCHRETCVISSQWKWPTSRDVCMVIQTGLLVSLFVSLPLWSRLKYPINYWMDYHFVLTFVVPRCWILLTLVIPLTFPLAPQQGWHIVFYWNISTTIGQIVVKFGSAFMSCSWWFVITSVISHLDPSCGQHFILSSTSVSEKAAKLTPTC